MSTTEPIVLNSTESFDTTTGQLPLTWTWICSTSGFDTCIPDYCKDIKGNIIQFLKQPVLKIEEGTLESGTYYFKVFVSSSGRRDSDSVTIYYQNGIIPNTQIVVSKHYKKYKNSDTRFRVVATLKRMIL